METILQGRDGQSFYRKTATAIGLIYLAGMVVGIGGKTSSRFRDADKLQQPLSLLERRTAAHPAMIDDRLGDLHADRQDRVERSHRLLKDHR